MPQGDSVNLQQIKGTTLTKFDNHEVCLYAETMGKKTAKRTLNIKSGCGKSTVSFS
jgi:hypothetical protein